jgi:hypothetical protein
MLNLLYEGLSNADCAEAYVTKFPDTTRTISSLKTKFNWLRNDLGSKLSGHPAEKNNEAEEAFDFLYPAVVHRGDQFYYLYRKSRFTEIKVGWLGSKIRFQLVQNLTAEDLATTDWVGATFDGASCFMFVLDLDSRFVVEKLFEDEFFKGVELKLKPISGSKQISGFDMY